MKLMNHASVPPPSAGIFGHWVVDSRGLPAYDYTADQFAEPACETFTTYGASRDHYHLIGNSHLKCVVHNGGYVEVLAPGQGFMYLNHVGEAPEAVQRQRGAAITFLERDGLVQHDLFTTSNPPTGPLRARFRRLLGANYFEKASVIAGLEVTHRVIAGPPGLPLLLSEITMKNPESNSVQAKLTNYWGLAAHYLLRSAVVMFKGRRHFGKTRLLNAAGKLLGFVQRLFHMDTTSSRNKWANSIGYQRVTSADHVGYALTYKKVPQNHRSNLPADTPPALKTAFLAPLFLGSVQFGAMSDLTLPQRNNPVSLKSGPALWWSCLITLAPGESKTFYSAFGYADAASIKGLIVQARELVEGIPYLDRAECDLKQYLLSFEVPGEEWLTREVQWHSAYLRNALYYDEFFRLHKLPQLSIYAFGHGFDGAIRDYALFLPSLVLTQPAVAREFLTYMLSWMKEDGTLLYGLYGFGKAIPFVHAKASDLYLFLLWAVTEYVYSTRDFAFLKEEFPYYAPAGPQAKTGTVIARVQQAIDFLFSEKVGIGPHGLVKVNDGDWSDGISFLVENRKKFLANGESSFNTTLALYVFPRLLPLLHDYLPERETQVQSEFSSLEQAIGKAWNGRWFYRGYDGLGGPVGDKELFLEHHTWYLISQRLPPERVAPLLSAIQEMLENPSPAGQLISFPPRKSMLSILPPGWDVNGGIWHAINALLTWGYTYYDINRAWQSLVRNSMHAREVACPKIWYGIWTGPDAYIAPYGERPGEAFFHLATPMCDFPAFNMNLHADFLLSLAKLAGFESTFGGLRINAQWDRPFKFESRLVTISSTSTTYELKYCPLDISGEMDIEIVGDLASSLKLESIHGACLLQTRESTFRISEIQKSGVALKFQKMKKRDPDGR